MPKLLQNIKIFQGEVQYNWDWFPLVGVDDEIEYEDEGGMDIPLAGIDDVTDLLDEKGVIGGRLDAL